MMKKIHIKDSLIEIDIQASLKVSESTDEIVRLTETSEYQDFFEKCLTRNEPCIIENVTDHWWCRKNWLSPDEKINPQFLSDRYGSATVTVAQCHKKVYNVHEKKNMTVFEYMRYWSTEPKEELLYLKDWHFTKTFPEVEIYRVPKFFASDWLNEYYHKHPELDDDYKFVYIGPKGSWTPLHADVFSSYSWSVNVTGKKRWILFRPGCESRFRDNLGNLIFDMELKEAVPEHGQIYEIIQQPGQAIFVPSGWHHQVWNLEDTFSINHNWINGSNVHNLWLSMWKNLQDVKKEIEDCRDMENWEDHCQIMLKALFGMDYADFFSFISEIANSRMEMLHKEMSYNLPSGWFLGPNYLLYDVKQVSKVLQAFLKDENLLQERLKEEATKFCCEVDLFLANYT